MINVIVFLVGFAIGVAMAWGFSRAKQALKEFSETKYY